METDGDNQSGRPGSQFNFELEHHFAIKVGWCQMFQF